MVRAQLGVEVGKGSASPGERTAVPDGRDVSRWPKAGWGAILGTSVVAFIVVANVLGSACDSSRAEAGRKAPGLDDRRSPSTPQAPPSRRQDRAGHQAEFDAVVRRVGRLTLESFSARFRAPRGSAKGLSWDPSQAEYCSARGRGAKPFDLRPEERALLRKGGFVVLGRHGQKSFGASYLDVWQRDLPVFITADSVLHAWHRSFDAVLEELEEQVLTRQLSDLLAAMARAIPAARAAAGAGLVGQAVGDADLFLAVARSLLSDAVVPPEGGVDFRLLPLLAAARAEQTRRVELFGTSRRVDFSQLRPRGHYTRSDTLKRYFRAMMWLGRVDFRVLGFGNRGHAPEPELRQLAGALVLLDLLERSERYVSWQRFDWLLTTFIGRADSMTFAQLKAIRNEARLPSVSALARQGMEGAARALEALQRRIARDRAGAQKINTHLFSSSPYGPDQVELPRSFTFLGQRESLDAYALSKVVADAILWDGKKVQRRMPSALDVAFSVFANDHTVPFLVRRIRSKDGLRFRDGLPYQHNLAAVRALHDGLPKEAWQRSLYDHWLGTLRTLSRPPAGARVPEAMRTSAWALRLLNTQLASWTQLRHDTILYVKQSVTARVTCDHPAALVELVPAFWERLESMARAAAAALRGTLLSGPSPSTGGPDPLPARQARFFDSFAEQARWLGSVARRQLAGTPLPLEEASRLRNVVEVASGGCGPPTYRGWYPRLFYQGGSDFLKEDLLVADVHTDPPAEFIRDPGGVLHQGVGDVDLLLVAARQGGRRLLFAGPTFSHYEFVEPHAKRLTDEEWKARVGQKRLPPRPEWTHGYLLN